MKTPLRLVGRNRQDRRKSAFLALRRGRGGEILRQAFSGSDGRRRSLQRVGAHTQDRPPGESGKMVHIAFARAQVGAVMGCGEVRFQHRQHGVTAEFMHHRQEGVDGCGEGNGGLKIDTKIFPIGIVANPRFAIRKSRLSSVDLQILYFRYASPSHARPNCHSISDFRLYPC